mgnify:CR=1 FL=1
MRRTILPALILCCAGAVSPTLAQPPTPPKQSADALASPGKSTSSSAVITALAIAPGGQLVATAGDDHLVRLWSTTSGRLVHLLKVHTDWVRTLAFSPDGSILASAGDDGQIVLWRAENGQVARRIQASERPVYAIDFSPDGRTLAAAGFAQYVTLFDAQSGAVSQRLEGPAADLRAVTFSPDGGQLAAGGRGGRIRVWPLPRASTFRDLQSSTARIRALAWLPDGQRLASAGHGRTISIWEPSSGKEHYRFPCPAGTVMAMTVCGEDWLATGGSDNVVRVWNWKTQTEVDRLVGHTGSVAAMAWDPASATIITGSFDTTVRVWKLNLSSPPAADRAATRVDESRR